MNGSRMGFPFPPGHGLAPHRAVARIKIMPTKEKSKNTFPFKKITGDESKPCMLCGDLFLQYWISEVTPGIVLCDRDYKANYEKKNKS